MLQLNLRMLPDIERDDREPFGTGDALTHQRAILVGGRDDLQCAILVDEPSPSGPEDGSGSLLKRSLEFINGAKVLRNSLFQLAVELRTSLQVLPEEGVVGVTSRVVPDTSLLFGWDLVELRDNLIDRQGRQLVIFQEVIEVVDICLVVLGVMDLHRLLVEVRLESIIAVAELRK